MEKKGLMRNRGISIAAAAVSAALVAPMVQPVANPALPAAFAQQNDGDNPADDFVEPEETPDGDFEGPGDGDDGSDKPITPGNAPADLPKELHGQTVIWADAVENGYVESVSNLMGYRNLLSGRAFEVSEHGQVSGTGLPQVPAGTVVYMQWQDTDGAVSPYYAAKVGTGEGFQGPNAQGGPGLYAFDLRQPWTDANGNEHLWEAKRGQKYRLWIPAYEDDEGVRYNMIRQANPLLPGGFTDGGANGATRFLNHNVQFTRILMAQAPKIGLMTRPKDEWIDGTIREGDKHVVLTGLTPGAKYANTVSGTVWKETGNGRDKRNAFVGPSYQKRHDFGVPGATVIFSKLTPEGFAEYDAAVNQLDDQSSRTKAAEKFLAENPHAIAYTYYTKTDDKGQYTIQLPPGAINDGGVGDQKDIWMGVLDENGNAVTNYSPWMVPQFHSPDVFETMRPRDPGTRMESTPVINVPTMALNNKLTSVAFALMPFYDANINVTNFDTETRPATPGDVAELELNGTLLPLPNWIEWRDADGNTVKGGPGQCMIADNSLEGNPCATFDVPENAAPGTVYTAVLVNGDPQDRNQQNVFSADSFVVAEKQNAEYQPVYEPTDVKPGEEKTIPAPKNEDPDKPLPNGTEFSAPETPGNKIIGPNGDITEFPGELEINPDGSIRVKPDPNAPVGKYEIPVLVTYPDGSKETVYAPVTVTFVEPEINNNPGQADDITPSWENQKTPAGKPVTAPNVGEDLPEGSKVGAQSDQGWKTEVNGDKITVTPPKNAKPGDKSTIYVVVTYPDGTQDLEKFTVTVNDPNKPGDNATETTPDWKNAETPPGVPVDVPNTGDKLPVGSKVTVPEDIDGWKITTGPDGSTITVTPPADAKKGDKIEVPVTVTHPDGSVDKETFTVTVVPDPDWDDKTTTPKTPVTIDKKDDSGDVKPGTTVETEGPGTATIDDKTGVITVTPNDDAKPGDEITVTVKDPNDREIDKITVTITDGPDGPGDGNNDAPKWDDKTTEPKKPVDVPNTGGPIEGEHTLEVEGPGTAELKPDGTITVTPKDNAKDGDKIVVTVKDPKGNVVDTVTVTIKESGPGLSSQIDGQKCTNALLGWGLPLLLMIPIGIATQVSIPGLEGLKAQLDQQIRNANTELQRQLGIHNPEMAKAAADLDARLKAAGANLSQALAGLAVLAYGLGALIHLSVVCLPKGEVLPENERSSRENLPEHLKPGSSIREGSSNDGSGNRGSSNEGSGANANPNGGAPASDAAPAPAPAADGNNDAAPSAPEAPEANENPTE